MEQLDPKLAQILATLEKVYGLAEQCAYLLAEAADSNAEQARGQDRGEKGAKSGSLWRPFLDLAVSPLNNGKA